MCCRGGKEAGRGRKEMRRVSENRTKREGDSNGHTLTFLGLFLGFLA